MKNGKFKRLCAALLAGVLTVGLMAGCGSNGGGSNSGGSVGGSTESGSGTGGSDDGGSGSASGFKTDIKIGVLVADVSGEEALGFRKYYEEYIAEQYGAEFVYTDALESAEDEKAAIEKFATQGCDAIISISGADRAMQIETCEAEQVYYAIAAGVLDDEQYETYKGYEYFVGQVGPSNQTEYEAGQAMGEYYKNQGVSSVAVYGAFIPNPMHVYRTAGLIVGLGDTYGGADDLGGIVGQIFGDQGVKLDKIAGDVEICAYLQGYGDTTTDEINAAIQKNPDAFLSVGMATTFFAQPLSEAGISYSDIDAFTSGNGDQMKNGTLTYLAGKYSSSVAPAFALVVNAVNGNVIRDNGNAAYLSQGYKVATDGASFDECYIADNGDAPIYDKTVVDSIIGADVTFDDVKALVESK